MASFCDKCGTSISSQGGAYCFDCGVKRIYDNGGLPIARMKDLEHIISSTMETWRSTWVVPNELSPVELEVVRDKAEAEWKPVFNEWYKLNQELKERNKKFEET